MQHSGILPGVGLAMKGTYTATRLVLSCVLFACESRRNFIHDVQGLPPAEYEAKKERVADELVARVEAHLPGLAAATVFREVSHPVHCTPSSHLGLISCLTLILKVSTQHDVQTFTEGTSRHSQENCT